MGWCARFFQRGCCLSIIIVRILWIRCKTFVLLETCTEWMEYMHGLDLVAVFLFGRCIAYYVSFFLRLEKRGRNLEA